MVIAAAQTKPRKEDIIGNLSDHYTLIDLAIDNGVQLIAFPEMSITGYERELAKKQALVENDSRLDKLRDLSVKNNLIIVAGAPIKMDLGLYIGSFVLLPCGLISIYTKQFLHSGEEVFYNSSFNYNPIIELENERISLAICADIENPLHAENASKKQITTYIASIFFTPTGMSGAYDSLSGYAKKYSMNVLMSNYSGESWGLESGGKSAFWTKNGDLTSSLDDKSTGLVITTKKDDIWTGKTIKMK